MPLYVQKHLQLQLNAFTDTEKFTFCHFCPHFSLSSHPSMSEQILQQQQQENALLFPPFFIHMMATQQQQNKYIKNTVVIMYVCYWKKATNSKVYALPPAFTHPFLTNWLWYNFVFFIFFSFFSSNSCFSSLCFCFAAWEVGEI